MIELTWYLIATFKEVWKKAQEMREDRDQLFVFEGDDTPIPNNMEQTFMKEGKQEWIKWISRRKADQFAQWITTPGRNMEG